MSGPCRSLRDNGLLLACLSLFAVFFVGMVVSGAAAQSVSLVGYLHTGDFVEALFENWESEFLQMGMYVVLTVFLFQRGSSESKPMDEDAPQDADPRMAALTSATPWPVRRGGWVLRVYENSLAIAFFVLFVGSWALHAAGGAAAISVSFWQYITTAQFWFESMQNWQSEFIAVAAIVGLSIFLRQRGSAESKPVADPHRETSA